MRKLFAGLFLFANLFFAGCTKDEVSEIPLNEMPGMNALQQFTGDFMNGPYGRVSGKVQLFKNTDGSYDIKLEDFSSDNGPDLYVYLSAEIQPVNFLELGKLRSVAGNQVYRVPGNPDLSRFRYVCIHCKQYNHLFGYALLK